MEKDKRIFLICEGGYHSLYYLLNNGFLPYRVYLDVLAIRLYLPYMTKEDEVIIVLTGLTDFTSKEVDELMKLLYEFFGEKSSNIKLFSPYKLLGMSYNYYIYSNDLIYCNVKAVVDGKIVALDSETGEKNITENTNMESSTVKNVVLEPYMNYESVEVDTRSIVIIDGEEKEAEETSQLRYYLDSLVRVDMYNNS